VATVLVSISFSVSFSVASIVGGIIVMQTMVQMELCYNSIKMIENS